MATREKQRSRHVGRSRCLPGFGRSIIAEAGRGVKRCYCGLGACQVGVNIGMMSTTMGIVPTVSSQTCQVRRVPVRFFGYLAGCQGENLHDNEKGNEGVT